MEMFSRVDSVIFHFTAYLSVKEELYHQNPVTYMCSALLFMVECMTVLCSTWKKALPFWGEARKVQGENFPNEGFCNEGWSQRRIELCSSTRETKTQLDSRCTTTTMRTRHQGRLHTEITAHLWLIFCSVTTLVIMRYHEVRWIQQTTCSI